MIVKEDGLTSQPQKPPSINEDLEEHLINDLVLLILLLLIEASTKKNYNLTFSTFSKYPFKDALDKIDGAHDYESVADYIYETISYHLGESQLNFFKIKEIFIDKEKIIPEIVLECAKAAREIPPAQLDELSSMSEYFAYIIEKAFELMKEGVAEKGLNEDTAVFKFAPEKFKRYSADLLSYAPSSIELSFNFDQKQTSTIQDAINQFVIDKYDTNEIYEFKDFLSGLKFANGIVKIPFSSIIPDKFRIVETLKYLDIKKQIEIQNWAGKNDYWEIRLIAPDLLALFVPNIDLLIQKKDSITKNPEVRLTEDGNLEYEGCPTIFDLPPLQKALCKKLYLEKVNYNFDTLDVENTIYGNDSTKKIQYKLRKLIERLNGRVREEFGIQEWIRYGTNNLRRLI